MFHNRTMINKELCMNLLGVSYYRAEKKTIRFLTLWT